MIGPRLSLLGFDAPAPRAPQRRPVEQCRVADMVSDWVHAWECMVHRRPIIRCLNERAERELETLRILALRQRMTAAGADPDE